MEGASSVVYGVTHYDVSKFLKSLHSFGLVLSSSEGEAAPDSELSETYVYLGFGFLLTLFVFMPSSLNKSLDG